MFLIHPLYPGQVIQPSNNAERDRFMLEGWQNAARPAVADASEPAPAPEPVPDAATETEPKAQKRTRRTPGKV